MKGWFWVLVLLSCLLSGCEDGTCMDCGEDFENQQGESPQEVGAENTTPYSPFTTEGGEASQGGGNPSSGEQGGGESTTGGGSTPQGGGSGDQTCKSVLECILDCDEVGAGDLDQCEGLCLGKGL